MQRTDPVAVIRWTEGEVELTVRARFQQGHEFEKTDAELDRFWETAREHAAFMLVTAGAMDLDRVALVKYGARKWRLAKEMDLEELLLPAPEPAGEGVDVQRHLRPETVQRNLESLEKAGFATEAIGKALLPAREGAGVAGGTQAPHFDPQKLTEEQEKDMKIARLLGQSAMETFLALLVAERPLKFGDIFSRVSKMGHIKSDTTVRKTLHALGSAGVIDITERKGSGRFGFYRVYWPKHPHRVYAELNKR